MGEKRNAYRLLVGKPGGNRPLGRPRRRWVDNIRMDLGEMRWDDVDWIYLALNLKQGACYPNKFFTILSNRSDFHKIPL
jgi:hypothetical protein